MKADQFVVLRAIRKAIGTEQSFTTAEALRRRG